MNRVVIGIPTYRRPDSLRRLLASLAALEPVVVRLTVLIADNDADGRDGIRVATEVAAAGFPHELISVPVAKRGLAAVRNALMDHAFDELNADRLAMIDDDERVEPGWLRALERTHEEFSADLTFGAILPDFHRSPPAWAIGQPLFWGNRYEHGRAFDAPGSGAILVDARVHRDLALRFDEAYSYSGGEDRDFFCRLRARGGAFAHASDAISYEHVGADRLKRRWLLLRAFRVGSTDIRISLKYRRSGTAWLLDMAKIPLATAVGLLGTIALPFDAGRQMRCAAMASRQAGKIAGLVGWSARAYANNSGRLVP